MQISPSTSDRIHYVGNGQSPTLGEVSVYRVELESLPVLDIHVQITDGTIHVGRPNQDPLLLTAPNPQTKTNGVAKFREEMVEDADGSPVGVVRRPSGASVYRYVLPRLPHLMAKVYVTPAS